MIFAILFLISFSFISERPVVKRITDTTEIKPKKDEVIISFMKSNSHPNYGVMCFKISYQNKTLVYATDTECYFGGSKKLELFANFNTASQYSSQ